MIQASIVPPCLSPIRITYFKICQRNPPMFSIGDNCEVIASNVSMLFFLYIVYELLVGLAAATNSETDPVVKGKIQTAQLMTVVSWCTYPVVYLFPMLGINAAHAVVSIQIGYCASDIISKCGVCPLCFTNLILSGRTGLLCPFRSRSRSPRRRSQPRRRCRWW